MRINKITFTGADNNTNPNRLKEIQNKYPHVEWGILVSSNNNRNRYPCEEYILGLKDMGLNLSLHLCGKYSRSIMQDDDITLKYDWFDRYQINFNFKNNAHDLNNFYKLANKYPDKKFILQSNQSNDYYIDEILKNDISNVNVLYDASGGRGTEIKNISYPYKNVYTGYSGGINLDNIWTVCEAITSCDDDSEVWIDMESGVRTNDEFDLDKVKRILETEY